MKLFDELKSLLKKDERLVSEGELLKNRIVELALKLDIHLIKLLLANDRIKRHFFTEVDKALVFDKEKFMKFIDNKEFLPDSYTAFKNKIGLTSDKRYIAQSKEVVLSWPYKDCILEGGQEKEDEKRKEIFHNEILAPDEIDRLLEPKAFTNFKRIDAKGEHKVTEVKPKDNLIIKGNNLLVLHSLKKKFSAKVKLIYIDPPFNTGNDEFNYNNSFNHSTWLTFMKNRLEVAKELLKPDGVIIVHCDFIEDNYLKVLMDEVFGRDKFINSIAIRDSHPSGLKLSARRKTIVKTKSTMLVYKRADKINIRPIYQKRYNWDRHFSLFIDIDKKKNQPIPLKKYIEDNNIVSDKNFVLDDRALLNRKFREFAFNNKNKIFQSTKEIPKDARERSLRNKGKVIEYKSGEFALNGRRLSPLSKSICNIGIDGYYEEEFGKLLCDFWDDIDFNNSQNEGGISLISGKKPEYLIARLITMFTKRDEIICDFFLGAGTSTAVAHKMGRQYIGIEQLDYGENSTVIRLKNVIGKATSKGKLVETIEDYDTTGISKTINWKGGADFVYCELKELNEEFVQKIKKAKDTKELLNIWEVMKEHAFLSYRVDPKLFDEKIEEFRKLTTEEQKKLLIECLDVNNLYVNFSEIEDKQYKISKEDIELNKKFYRRS